MSSLKFLFSTASTTENKVTDEVDNDNGNLSPLPRVPGILVAGVGSVGCEVRYHASCDSDLIWPPGGRSAPPDFYPGLSARTMLPAVVRL